MHKLLFASLLLLPLIAFGEEPQPPADAPPASKSNADEPDGFDAGGAEVNIITEGDKRIEEYSLNGRIYMVRIQQKGFPPYYLIDRDGDGRMDEQVSELMAPRAPPPNWELFRW